MLSEAEMTLVWCGYYAVGCLFVGLMWMAFRKIPWRVVRQSFFAICSVCVLMPWNLYDPSDQWAPALLVLVLETMTYGVAAGSRVAIPFAVALFSALAIVWVAKIGVKDNSRS